MKIIQLELKIIYGKPRHSHSQDSVERANQDIENVVTTQIKDNKPVSWSHGLKLIQFMKNREFQSGIQKTPDKAKFGCAPRIGLFTTPIPRKVFDSIKAE